MSPQVDILMATYCGGKYLEAQIDSIVAQTHQNWQLLIRDDCSTDNTRGLLQTLAEKYGQNRIVLLPSEERLGIIDNFATLMQHAEAPYIMFSDQDDVWYPEKVEKSLKCMHEMELRFGLTSPLLVHTDLTVVDKELKTLHPSFIKYASLLKRQTLNHLLQQNAITGCTMMMNQQLVKLALPIPLGACMHDWWITLVAAAFGHVHTLQEATMAYRQHGHNQVGALPYDYRSVLSKMWQAFIKRILFKKKTSSDSALFFKNLRVQAAAFKHRYEEHLNHRQIKMIDAFLSSYCAPPARGWKRRWHMLRYGFFTNRKLANIADFLR